MASSASDNAAHGSNKTASVDIPKPFSRDGRLSPGPYTFAAVAAKSFPGGVNATQLPTPPHSISPSLPPHGFQRGAAKFGGTLPASPELDSDIDLQRGSGGIEEIDDKDHRESDGTATVQTQHGFPIAAPSSGQDWAMDLSGAITPALLAKHHLPEILLAHGPLAIRHVMGYLTTSVPGFSGIPPAKARRLVVGALEGRGTGADAGGINGDVLFEKVGWGRWDARVKGQPARESRGIQQSSLLDDRLSPPPSLPSSSLALSHIGVPTSRMRIWNDSNAAFRSTSWTGDSAIFSHDEDMDPKYSEDISMLENEADKMSLDGDASCTSSEAMEDVVEEDMDDATDEEDWAQIGAAALRQGVLSRPSKGRRDCISSHLQILDRRGLLHTGSVGSHLMHDVKDVRGHIGFSGSTGFGVGSDSQEREAIEALVRLSSV